MSDPNNMMAQLNQLLGQNNTQSFQMPGLQADFSSLGAYQPNNVNAFAGTGLGDMLKSLTNIGNQPAPTFESKPQGNWFTNNIMDINDETGKMDTKWGMQALQGLGDIASFGMNWGQYNLAKDSIKQQNALNKANFNTAIQTTNTSMEGRARARYESNPEKYAKPADYMAKNKLKGYGG